MEAGPTIPSPLEDDDEDVHWALSTASALWARGERSESLKWLRRAAETASDANADQRALDLFKAAADVAQRIGTLPPPPSAASVASQSAPPATQASAPPQQMQSRPPPVPSAPPPGVHVVHRSGGPPPPPPPRRVSPAFKQTATLASPVAAPPAPPPMPPSSKRPAPPPSRPSEPMPPPLVAREPRSVGPRSSGSGGPPARAAHTATLPSGMPSPAAHAPPPAPPPPSSARNAAKPTPATRSSSGSSRDGLARGQVSAASLDFGSDHASTPSSSVRGQTGAAADPQRARTRTRPHLERPRVDDEVTIQRDISSLGLRFDDLDEDTKIIPGRQQLGRVLLAVDPFRSDATPASDENEHEIADHMTTPGEDGADGGLEALRAAWAARAQQEAVPSTMPAAHLAALPSLRVAVLGTSDHGDVRILPLAPGSAAPAGAATAILVPLTQEDGEAIARLFEPPKSGR